MTQQQIPAVLIEGRKYSAEVWEDWGNTWWVAIKQGGKIVKSARFDTKQEAEEFGRRHADI